MPLPNYNPITLVIATRNLHKAGEIRAILSEKFQYRTLNDMPGAPNVVEDNATFAGNATKKALQLAQWLAQGQIDKMKEEIWNYSVLADDSGLEVDALKGAPGVHSARFAALEGNADGSSITGNSPDAANN